MRIPQSISTRTALVSSTPSAVAPPTDTVNPSSGINVLPLMGRSYIDLATGPFGGVGNGADISYLVHDSIRIVQSYTSTTAGAELDVDIAYLTSAGTAYVAGSLYHYVFTNPGTITVQWDLNIQTIYDSVTFAGPGGKFFLLVTHPVLVVAGVGNAFAGPLYMYMAPASKLAATATGSPHAVSMVGIGLDP